MTIPRAAIKRLDKLEGAIAKDDESDIEQAIERALVGDALLDPSIEALLDEYEEVFLDDEIFIQSPGYLLKFFDVMTYNEVSQDDTSNFIHDQRSVNIEDYTRYHVPAIEIPEWMMPAMADSIEEIDLSGVEPRRSLDIGIGELLDWNPLRRR